MVPTLDSSLAVRARIERLLRRLRLIPSYAAHAEGRAGIALIGHREYVGGLWDEIGRLQFDFLVAQGLKTTDVLIDVGCGSLRGGIHFVPYLMAGNYLGIDKEPSLLAAGRSELGPAVVAEKRPQLRVSDSFDFGGFDRAPTFGIAQSLFSHLSRDDIAACLEHLRPVMASSGRFYATFNERSEAVEAPRSHSWAFFAYPHAELEQIGRAQGWEPIFIGDFGHPRGQVMMRFDAAS